MRFSWTFPVVVVAVAGLAAAYAGCGGATRGGPVDAGGPVSDVALALPVDAGCDGGGAGLLTGTVALDSAFMNGLPTLSSIDVNLYTVFPSGIEGPAYTSTLDPATSNWAFNCLASGTHYYVQAVAHFNEADGSGASVPAIVGPLSVPPSAPVAVQVHPVEIEVLESRGVGAGMAAQWASVHVFDPAYGSEILGGAAVTIDIGTGAPVPLPWALDPNGKYAFYTTFLNPPAALSTYNVVVNAPDAGAALPASWQVVAAVPTFDGAILAPMGGATVPVMTDLSVQWMPEPLADFEAVTLFAKDSMGAWSPRYQSPLPHAADDSNASETIPAANLGFAGSYLLNVAYTKANCPATANGCVLAETVPDVTSTVK